MHIETIRISNKRGRKSPLFVAMISKEKVRELAQERIDDLNKGLYLVDISISPKNAILIEIDNMNGGVAIEDCVSVSRNVEHNLDREVEDFELSVTSPGLDQPFKVHQQYNKNIGRNVKVVFKDHGSVEGLLKEVSDEGVVIETTEKEKVEGKKKKVEVVKQHPIPFQNIKETKVIISFK